MQIRDDHIWFSTPVKILGVGMPMKEILEPSVPPRIGSQMGDTCFSIAALSYVERIPCCL